MLTIISFTYKKLSARLRNLSKKYSLPRWAVFAQDTGAVFLTFLLAYLLRFNFQVSDVSFSGVLEHALLVTAVFMAVSLIFKPYSGIIRHTTIRDVFNVMTSTTVSLLILIGITVLVRKYGWGRVLNIPLSILLIHYVCVTAVLLAARIAIKMGFEMIVQPRHHKKNILIYGAGSMGVIVKQVIQNDLESGYNIAGFIDDSRQLHGKKISGITIHSPKILTNGFIKKNNITGLVFAIKEISPGLKAKIIRKALDVGLEVLETPTPESWINSQLQVRQLQKVKIEDLLGRDPIKLDIDTIQAGLAGKTILVTGAAGSIGSEIVRQLAQFNVQKLVLIDQAETPMFHLGLELKEKFPSLPAKLIIADITKYHKMDIVFSRYRPDIVYHAAAYKHVPLMEENPHEAFRVNVGGTRILTKLASLYKVEKFVMISTDKAVNPTNVMGASKRVCEMVVQAKSQLQDVTTRFVTTRFGNVLGSNGSVIPLFMKQIEKGGPVTITHPDITRYFMTIPEACQLVLEAGFIGQGGEIFVFDMGKPVRITDLANQMIRLSGLVPGKDIQIEYTGLRPGEKLYEELLADEEVTLPTHHPKVRIAKVRPVDQNVLLDRVDKTLLRLYLLQEKEIVQLLKVLVPEYIRPDNASPNENEKERQQIESIPLPSFIFSSNTSDPF